MYYKIDPNKKKKNVVHVYYDFPFNTLILTGFYRPVSYNDVILQ